MGSSYPDSEIQWDSNAYQPTPGPEDSYISWQEEEPRRPPYLMVVFCSACVSALTVVALFLVMETITSGGKVSVPALVGMNLVQARTSTGNIKLVISMAGSVNDPVIEKGRVARQVPLAGAQARPGQTVAVTLSRGSGQVTMGGMTGLILATGRTQLKELGLVAGQVSYLPHSSVAAGRIINTNPSAGSILSAGTRVALSVSSGPEAASAAKAPSPGVTPAKGLGYPAPPAPPPAAKRRGQGGVQSVPKVTGVRLPFAVSRLRSRGLSPGRISYSRDEDHMEDFVLSQSPRPGTPAAKGDKVDLVVNKVD